MFNSIIPRDQYEPGGFIYEFRKAAGMACEPLPRNVAYLAPGGRYGQEQVEVTWDDVMQRRREYQANRLNFKRQPAKPEVEACYVWVFNNGPVIPYGGWWCYMVTLRQPDGFSVNFRGLNERLAINIMSEVPCGFLPLPKNFDRWMEAFAKKFPRRQPAVSLGQIDDRDAGSIHGWLKDGSFTLKHP